MTQKVNPMLITDSDSDNLSDFNAFRVTERKVESKMGIFLEIELWSGGRLTGTVSLPNLARLEKQIIKILKGRYNDKATKTSNYSEEDFLQDLEDHSIVSGS